MSNESDIAYTWHTSILINYFGRILSILKLYLHEFHLLISSFDAFDKNRHIQMKHVKLKWYFITKLNATNSRPLLYKTLQFFKRDLLICQIIKISASNVKNSHKILINLRLHILINFLQKSVNCNYLHFIHQWSIH